MKSITLIKDVLAAMGTAMKKEALLTEGINLGFFKEFDFNPSELHAAGFDIPTLKAAGFTANNFKAALMDLPILLVAGYDRGTLYAAGYSDEEFAAAGVDISDIVVSLDGSKRMPHCYILNLLICPEPRTQNPKPKTQNPKPQRF